MHSSNHYVTMRNGLAHAYRNQYWIISGCLPTVVSPFDEDQYQNSVEKGAKVKFYTLLIFYEDTQVHGNK